MGPTSTLPSNHQPTPPGRTQRARRPDPDADLDLVLGVDQPPSAPPELTERDRAGDLALDPAAAQRHREPLECWEADRTSRLAEPPQEPEPLGRCLPEPLASREGVER